MRKQRSFRKRVEDVTRKWFVIDAKGKVVGRLATETANLLRGKRNVDFTPNIDDGDGVIILNCEDVVFTGNKLQDKVYYWHTNHIGGIKKRTAKEQLERHPELVLLKAVERMLPKTSLGRKQLTRLRVFKGENHNLKSQNPIPHTFK